MHLPLSVNPDRSGADPLHRIGSNASPNGLRPRTLARVQAYIQAHLCERMSLAQLAAAACMSRFHFARMFRVSTGHSPMDYVLKLRLEAAKTLLDSGTQRVSTTAATLGFFDQSHFTRTFRRLTGLSPSAYSAQQQQRAA